MCIRDRCIVLPLFSIFFMATIFGNGQMENLPVGIVDGDNTATTFFGLYMLAFLAGRWTGTLLMVKFRPQDMLLVYALINVLLCICLLYTSSAN